MMTGTMHNRARRVLSSGSCDFFECIRFFSSVYLAFAPYIFEFAINVSKINAPSMQRVCL